MAFSQQEGISLKESKKDLTQRKKQISLFYQLSFIQKRIDLLVFSK